MKRELKFIRSIKKATEEVAGLINLKINSVDSKDIFKIIDEKYVIVMLSFDGELQGILFFSSGIKFGLKLCNLLFGDEEFENDDIEMISNAISEFLNWISANIIKHYEANQNLLDICIPAPLVVDVPYEAPEGTTHRHRFTTCNNINFTIDVVFNKKI